MKVLLITRYFPPLDSIATHRMYAWAKYLVQLGCEVTVLTTDKTGQVVEPWDWDRSSFEVQELPYWDPILALGLTKSKMLSEGESSGGWRASLKRALKRFYRERMNERMPGRTDPWYFVARRWIKAQKSAGRNFDFVISSYGPPVCHLLGRKAQVVFQARWIADYRDLWLENHVFAGLWPFTLLERFLEKRAVRYADGISTVSEALAEVLGTKFPQIPVTVIENGFEPSLITEAPAGYFDRDPVKLRIVYTGSIYRGKRDPSPLFHAISALIDKGAIVASDLEVLFYGSQPGDLEELIAQANLGQIVRFCGYVGQTEAYSIQKSADLLLFLEAARPDVDGILTGKLFEYLYVDTPILAVGVSEESAAGALIREARAGLVCGNNVDKIQDALVENLAHKAAVCKRPEVVERYSREKQTARLLTWMRGLRRRRGCAQSLDSY